MEISQNQCEDLIPGSGGGGGAPLSHFSDPVRIEPIYTRGKFQRGWRPRLTNEELVVQIQQGKSECLAELWSQIEDLIRWAARRYYVGITQGNSRPAPGSATIDDLVQGGFFAVVDAVERFDPSLGTKFTTLLMLCLKRAFRREIGFRIEPLDFALSLDVPVDNEDENSATRLDFVPDQRDDIGAVEDHVFNEELHIALEDALDRLPEKEAMALRGEYFEGKSQIEIASEIGCSFQSISSIKKSALHHIRYSSSRQRLERFVDLETDFFKGSGNRRGVEHKAIIREAIRERYERGAIDDYKAEPVSGHVHWSVSDGNTGI